MAALEKIRKRAVFLTIVIGVALLAFILGDFMNSGRSFFGGGNTIAKVAGEKIDAMEFQDRVKEATDELQKNNQSMDASVVQQQVLNQMINEVLLNKEFENAGIYVTSSELSDYMVGSKALPYMYQFAQQCGVESPAQLYDLISNPSKYNVKPEQIAPLKAEWQKMEKQIESMIKGQKLQGLIAGAIQANDLDKKEIADETAVTKLMTYAKQDYSTVANDKTNEPTDAEIKAEYDKQKELLKLDEPVCLAHMIAVDVVPSASDNSKAKAEVDSALVSLRANAGVNSIRNNSNFIVNEAKVRAKDIRDPKVKEFVQSAATGAVSEPEYISNVYSFVKLNNKTVETDSVTLNMVMVQGDKKLQDAILGQLNSGKAVAEVVKANAKTVQSQENQIIDIVNMPDSLKTKLVNAGEGYFAYQSSPQGAYLINVVKKSAPKEIYNIAQINYKVYPSKATIDGLRDNLQNFINKNNTSKLLEDNAAKAGYQASPVQVSKNAPQLANIESTRKIVKWLFDTEKGSVSPIFDKENKDKMVVVALDNMYDGEYVPVTDPQVRESLAAKARSIKKGENLYAKLNGKANSVAEYAKLMNTKVDTAEVTFGSPFIPGINAMESELIGRASVAPKGKLQGLLKGNSAIFAYTISEEKPSTRKREKEEIEREFQMTRGSQAVMQNAINILKENNKVTNKFSKFF